jgi:hypothetical protein
MNYHEAITQMNWWGACIRRQSWDRGFYWMNSFGDVLEHSDSGEVYYAPTANDDEKQATDWEIYKGLS